MTTATGERLRNLKVGWRVRFELRDGLTLTEGEDPAFEGVVSEVNDTFLRVGWDDGSEFGRSHLIGFPDKGAQSRYKVQVLDTSGEVDAEVVDRVPSMTTTARALDDLTHEDPVQSDPSGNAIIADLRDGYAPVDEAGVVQDADGKAVTAGYLDDRAIADAEADNADRRVGTLLVTLHLPMPAGKVGAILGAVAAEFPGAQIDFTEETGGPAEEMRVRAKGV